jgi:UDP-N-acetylmuramyl pentapeptide phosphotransferase/UDP-N-acetylglucosamine-1-phosphate transferase
MDGIDGIAATQALVAGLGWCLLGKLASDGGAMLAGSIIAGAAAGFLVLNWAPATLFMGDVGSAFLGFTLAAMPLVADDTPRLAIPAVLMVWPFVFDASLTFLRRLARGENVFAAHRSHLYQRLTAVGWSHARVTTLYLVLDAIGVVAAVLWLQGGLGVLAASVLVVSGAVGLWLIVSRNERRFDSSTAAVVGLRRTEDHGRA